MFNGNLIWICALPKDNRVNEVGDKQFNLPTTPMERDKQCNGGLGKFYLSKTRGNGWTFSPCGWIGGGDIFMWKMLNAWYFLLVKTNVERTTFLLIGNTENHFNLNYCGQTDLQMYLIVWKKKVDCSVTQQAPEDGKARFGREACSSKSQFFSPFWEERINSIGGSYCLFPTASFWGKVCPTINLAVVYGTVKHNFLLRMITHSK